MFRSGLLAMYTHHLGVTIGITIILLSFIHRVTLLLPVLSVNCAYLVLPLLLIKIVLFHIVVTELFISLIFSICHCTFIAVYFQHNNNGTIIII